MLSTMGNGHFANAYPVGEGFPNRVKPIPVGKALLAF
jgi:hypothetical protein